MSRKSFVALSVLLDALFVNACFVAAFFIRYGGQPPAFNYTPYVLLWPLITAFYLLAGYVYGLYEPERTESAWAVASAVARATVLGILLTAATAFFLGPRFFSFNRLVILIAPVLQFTALVAWRLAALRLTPIRWPESRILILGTDDAAIELARELQRRSGWGPRVLGLIAREPVQDAQVAGFSVLGSVRDAARLAGELEADRIIVSSPPAVRELIEQLALSDEIDVRVEVVPDLYEIFIGTVDSAVSDIPLMQLTGRPVPGWFEVSKRTIDVVGALVLLTILSPVLLFAALGILVTMGRPVFYTQERVGKDLRVFRIVKFRTMVRDAERKTGPVLAEEDDPRITPFGRFLRRYRIDELPQLLNILKGDMSFIGPRPERPFFVEQHLREIPGYRERFRVKPGVTGLAQVSGGYATTAERKLKFDLIYMYHQSLLMDLQILVETLRVVLTGRGAR
ncbi:MAG: sugar transferase [Anaerosomatales bacterium]|nr:sugar transferase [Anaerosomatales bacterium]